MKRVKIFLGLGFISLLLTGCNFSSSNNNESREKPTAPTNLKYNEEACMLTWNAVQNTKEYELAFFVPRKGDIQGINYETVMVQTNEYSCVAPYVKTGFRVRATNNYGTSEWSENLVFEYSTDSLSLQTIEGFAREMRPSANVHLVRVVSIYAGNRENDKDVLYTKAVFDDDKIYEIRNGYDDEITSLNESIKNRNEFNSNYYNKYDVKNYDSISYYLQSGNYKSKLETYRQDGYSFESITSQSYEIDDATVGIDSILKLEKEDDVKYFATSLSFYVSSDLSERAKFTTELINITDRYVFLDAFVELEGDFVEAANLLATTQPNF